MFNSQRLVTMFAKKDLFSLLQILKYKLKVDRKSFVIRHIKNKQPLKILEIGVHSGDFAIRMLSSISYKNLKNLNYVGIDLFAEMQNIDNYKQEISLWAKSEKYVFSKIKSKFPMVQVQLHRGYSSKVLLRLEEQFDLIFIDGGHSYATVKSDWEVSSQFLLREGGVIFFDDYCSLTQSSKSGFGIKQVVDSIDRDKWRVKIVKAPDFFLKEWGLLVLSVVKVSKK
jgi:predicted O-methyltransferase YrrM